MAVFVILTFVLVLLLRFQECKLHSPSKPSFLSKLLVRWAHVHVFIFYQPALGFWGIYMRWACAVKDNKKIKNYKIQHCVRYRYLYITSCFRVAHVKNNLALLNNIGAKLYAFAIMRERRFGAFHLLCRSY